MDSPAYTRSLAHVYDIFRAGDNYDRWVALLHEAIRRWGVSGTRLLDVGCGTGLSSQAFAARGYRVTGCDESREMLEIALGRRGRYGIEFMQADARALPGTLRGFDVVSWMGDVANHLTDERDLTAAVRCSAQALSPGGLLLFDVNTLATFSAFFTGTRVIEREDAVFAWIGESATIRPDGFAQARLLAFTSAEAGGWRKEAGAVLERHHSGDTIRRAFAATGLEELACHGLYEGNLTDPGDESRQGKLIYVARRRR